VCRHINEQVISTLKEGDKKRSLWEVFFEHITNCRERNLVKLGITYHTNILSWLIVFLDRTSNQIYNKVAKLLMLPPISYIK
jgi:hypothetical protein